MNNTNQTVLVSCLLAFSASAFAANPACAPGLPRPREREETGRGGQVKLREEVRQGRIRGAVSSGSGPTGCAAAT
jgi:hypothetical protein